VSDTPGPDAAATGADGLTARQTRPSGPPDRRVWWLALVLAAFFLAAHLPFLASTLEDLDSVNFALGVRAFDPTLHRPHPPGYPIYIALAKIARLVLSEPHALAVVSALFGALAIFFLLRLFQALDVMDRAAEPGPPAPLWAQPAVLATLVTITSPLYWMTAVRPMSDLVGLSGSLAAMAVLATALVRQYRDMPDVRGRFDPAAAARSGRVILLGALLAGLVLGIRSQVLWLTIPPLMIVLAARVGRGAAGALIGAGVWYVLGVLIWLVPLIVASGGPRAYMAALFTVASADWIHADLLVTQPSAKRLATGLYDTFVVHWAGTGWFVMTLAVAGGLVLLRKRKRAAWFLAGTFAPYCVFHLLFQESVNIRYALPLVPVVAYLAVSALSAIGRLPAMIGAAACVLFSLSQVAPAVVAYSASGSPWSRAVTDVRTEAARVGPVSVGRHYSFARALLAELPDSPAIAVLPAEPLTGSRVLVREILAKRGRPVWFLDTPRHADVGPVDPRAVRVRGSYRWPFAAPVFLGYVRPGEADWLEIRDPGWVVGEGWFLSPQMAGISTALREGLGSAPAVAFIRPRLGAAIALVGGRNIGRAGVDADVRVTARVGNQSVDSWVVPAGPTFFLRVIALPAGVLMSDSPWTQLAIEAWMPDGTRRTPLVLIEQFDLQDEGRVMFGFDQGWYEQEVNIVLNARWRWSSAAADLRILPAGRDVDVRIAGESPLRSFERPSRIIMRAGGRILRDEQVSADFSWTVRVPAAALAASHGVVTLTTDQTFRPADRGQSADKRSLGLRIDSVSVTPAS
jgi:hypothetical protein